MGGSLYGMKELSDISLGRHLKEVQGASLSFCCSLDHALTLPTEREKLLMIANFLYIEVRYLRIFSCIRKNFLRFFWTLSDIRRARRGVRRRGLRVGLRAVD